MQLEKVNLQLHQALKEIANRDQIKFLTSSTKIYNDIEIFVINSGIVQNITKSCNDN